ncbi:unnamed protein product [Zymoseptoria tritici ST99CH_1A5]|uniref:Calcineurin-like phosphoesterase domain-containing protein n=1 Tax=Zymoseptoria tritici ST99CH_1A5 TaxID=1276529 RepID=A0A1Y6LVQ0_ZYMTR|nr:unnamed protein product [Zymoseptoria tritici ST99CH_1A5]
MGLACMTMAVAQLMLRLGNAQAGYEHAAFSVPGASSFVAPTGVPSSVWSSFYPVPTGQEPQPAVYDPILNITYPANLTNPDTIPDYDPDPVFYPQPTANLTLSEQNKVISDVVSDVKAKIADSQSSGNCSTCLEALSIAKRAAQLAPSLVPDALVSFCNATGFKSEEACAESYNASTFGAIWTQVLAFADVSGLDGHYICHSLSSTFCDAPMTSPLNATGLFPKPKPKHPKVFKPSGKTVKVLHMSDFHIDPRYKVGSEGNCTTGLCCRSNEKNSDLLSGQTSFPAPSYGYFDCDSPYDLGLAALQAVGPLTGTSKKNPFGWTIYTGDLVSHESQNELSRAYTTYAETTIYNYMFKSYLTGPVFAVLGNHDTNPEAITAPHSLPGPLGQQMSWNHDHVSALWKHEGWINDAAAAQARLHYGAYSMKNHYGLRMITFNSDFWYHSNILNFINTTNPDVSGTFQFVIDELQAAEDAGERVWLFAHVLSGWDGSNPMPNPTNLFYQIVERYSPHVIANIFFGHTHEDQFEIFYANNGTNQSCSTALNTAWIGPSVTPLTNLNSGFRMYTVDTGTFDIHDAYTFTADVSSFSNLTTTGPVFSLEYSTREAYGAAADWPAEAPLNATFWHKVTEAMEKDRKLVSQFNTYQGKSSVRTPNCTSEECTTAKICYMRSGSVALGQACTQGFGSVQSAFNPKKKK